MKKFDSSSAMYLVIGYVLQTVLALFDNLLSNWLSERVHLSLWEIIVGIWTVIAALVLWNLFKGRKLSVNVIARKIRKVRFIKKVVRVLIASLIYFMWSSMLVGASFYLGYYMEPKFLKHTPWWFMPSSTTFFLWGYPFLLANAYRRIGKKVKYLALARWGSGLYGIMGIYAMFSPTAMNSRGFYVVYVVFSLLLSAYFQVAVLLYLVDTWFYPWYRHLPEE